MVLVVHGAAGGTLPLTRQSYPYRHPNAQSENKKGLRAS
jgi:hypothetical protein